MHDTPEASVPKLEFNGTINIDIRDSSPDWAPFEAAQAPDGSQNVVMIVLDDVGFGAMSCYGGPIPTPNIDRLADSGIRYTQFHTTALCSPTRSCLLTGRNHTRNSMACITECSIGFPNGSGVVPQENGMLSEILEEQGWNTYAVGKWHLCPTEEMNLAATRRNWPSGRGFERFYGFLGAETNQWDPDLVYDNHTVDPPRTAEEGYHLTEDLTDKAIEFIRDAAAVAPDKPYFLYFAPGAAHAPHHAPREWIERFRGQFDMGYEAIRSATLAKQKAMGIVPQNTELPPVNPIGELTGPSGQPFPPLDVTRPWDSLSADEKRLFCRMAEVYAGFLGHADYHIGRLLDYIEESGDRDNTIIMLVSDNGASGEGGPNGSVNENKVANGIPDDINANLAMIDQLGGPDTYNHYPNGWAMAFNTPFKMWKRYEFNGGTSDPCIISWPSGIRARGELRHQYHHAIDLVPTALDLVGVQAPDTIKGFTQATMDGVSMRSSFDNAAAPSTRSTQFYSMLGSRGIWHDGWKAVTTHPALSGWGDFNMDTWELYHVEVDRSESHNLAAQEPDRLRDLVNMWFAEAGRNNAFPLDDRTALDILTTARPVMVAPRNRYTYFPDAAAVPEAQAVNLRNRSYSIGAVVDIPDGVPSGVLFAHGGRFGGHAMFVKDRRLHYVYNYVGADVQEIVANADVPTGEDVVLSASFDREGSDGPSAAVGTLSLYHGDNKVGEGRIRTQLGMFSIAGEGLCIGRDSGEPVTDNYPGERPWDFEGGTIQRVAVDVSGEPYVDLEREAVAMLSRE
jgi:arylsulfatase